MIDHTQKIKNKFYGITDVCHNESRLMLTEEHRAKVRDIYQTVNNLIDEPVTSQIWGQVFLDR